MSIFTRIALDAMGGDHAPGEIIKGAMDAISKHKDIKIFLVGQEELIKKITPGALTGVRMTIEGGIVMVGGIILGIACAMYAGAIMDMEDLEAEEENK